MCTVSDVKFLTAIMVVFSSQKFFLRKTCTLLCYLLVLFLADKEVSTASRKPLPGLKWMTRFSGI